MPNGTPVLAKPLAITCTRPVVAPDGTRATIAESLQELMAAGTPLNVTTLVPRSTPKPVPVTVIDVPADPVSGLILKRPGAVLNCTLLVVEPSSIVITTGPDVAPAGTATM